MSLSLADRLHTYTKAVRRRWIARLTLAQQRELPGRPWWFMGRPEQFVPGGLWRFWLILAGRGWGKTRTGAETAAGWARKYPGARIALIAISFADGRDTMVEGESGLLSVLAPGELRGGMETTAWNRSMGELFLANGSRFKIYTSERPKQLRGPQVHFAWGDEPAYWDDAAAGTAKDSTFSNLNFALRLPPRPGWPRDYSPRCVLTTTPRRVPLLKVPDDVVAERPYLAGLLQRDDVHITRGTTFDNIHNLDVDYRRSVVDPLIDTTLGRQELMGELLEDVEGALWKQADIDRDRVMSAPPLFKTAVAFDPAGGGGLGHDEHGIVGGGITGTRLDPQMYLLADDSINGTPSQAARLAILLYIRLDADVLVYEKNQGQDWIPTTIEATWADMTRAGEITAPLPRMQEVSAIRSKQLRAQPVAGFSEQKRIHHVGVFAILEGQQTTWVPGDTDSPDRLDAYVYLMTKLYELGPTPAAVASQAARERRGRRPDMPSTRLPVTFGSRPNR